MGKGKRLRANKKEKTSPWKDLEPGDRLIHGKKGTPIYIIQRDKEETKSQ